MLLITKDSKSKTERILKVFIIIICSSVVDVRSKVLLTPLSTATPAYILALLLLILTLYREVSFRSLSQKPLAEVRGVAANRKLNQA